MSLTKQLGDVYQRIDTYFKEKDKAEKRQPRGPGIDSLGNPINQELKSGFRTVLPNGSVGVKSGVFAPINHRNY